MNTQPSLFSSPDQQPTQAVQSSKLPQFNDDGYSVKGCSYIYAPSGQAGEYAMLATNPYRGCGHKCAYCLDGDTLIQMADGSAKPIKHISKGDEVIGIKFIGNDRAWSTKITKSKVLATVKSRKLAYKIRLENGTEVICSGDHRWLTERGWKYTADLSEGQRPHLTANNSIRILQSQPMESMRETDSYKLGYLSGMIRGDGSLGIYDYSEKKRPSGKTTGIQYRFRLALKDIEAINRTKQYLLHFGVETTEFKFKNATRQPLYAIGTTSPDRYRKITQLIEFSTDGEWYRGFLAGIFDAEGSNKREALRITNTDSQILEKIEEAFQFFSLECRREMHSHHASAIRLLGGRNAVIFFWQLTNPAIKRKFYLLGGSLRGSSKIISIEPLGTVLDMYDIQTETENFIANGLVSHNCYVPKVLRMDRAEFDAEAVSRPKFLYHLENDAAKYQALGSTDQVMLSFTTDAYNPSNTSLTRPTLEILQRYGMAICVLTKGGARALADIDLYRPNRDAFASTLTSLDDSFSLKWERGAALPGDRIATLKRFHEAGIFTWVSLEPTLSVESSLQIVQETHEFVDFYKIGRANYLPMTSTTDWKTYTERMVELCQKLGVKHYIKKDLQPYLPAGYHNPKRVHQHH